MSTLELRGVSAGYDGHVVLRDVSLTVPERSVAVLLGPNGAGKTTLLRVAAGVLAPQRGSVLLDGADVTGWPAHRLANRGLRLVPEGRGIYRTLSVAENLRLQAPPGAERSGFDDALSALPRLGERLKQKAGTMSGGEQQMLALARTYAARPDIALFDEVSMGLAPKIVDEIFDHLRELAEAGMALLIVEQYVKRALELADYVYVLNKGRIEFVGEPGELSEAHISASYLGSAV
ncbi:MAG TPA: ABC transporter ATP-binding protein [Acidimicrobiia bacterium]|nr:ABC transporter ATP-binding protein [Acidimicrobiia bacterium]